MTNGLIYSIDGGFAYADKTYDLVEHGIRRGHSIKRSDERPKRQVLTMATEADIIDMDKMFNN